MQPTLDFTTQPPLESLLARNSACARLARLLIQRRGEWIDASEIARVAGAYAWRTRCSDLRKAPWHLSVINRYRHVNQDGRKFVISEYMVA